MSFSEREKQRKKGLRENVFTGIKQNPVTYDCNGMAENHWQEGEQHMAHSGSHMIVYVQPR